MEGVLGELIGLTAVVLIFGGIPAIVIASRYFRSRERQQMQETIRMAIEKGQPLPTEVIDAISRDVRPAPSASRDVRVGFIWIGVAVGIAGFGYALGFNEDTGHAFYPMLGLAAFPGFIGLALIVLGLLGGGKGRS